MGKRKTILLVVVATVAIVILAALFALLTPPAPPPVAFPSPNGYESFLQGGMLVQKLSSEFSKINPQDLRNLVDANSNALQVVRTGLAEKSRVPLVFSEQYMTNHLQELAQMRMLAYAFLAEGRLAEMDQRTNDAIHAYLDGARLGVSLRRGGPLIDELVGFACESMGETKLENFTHTLDAKTSAHLAQELEALDADKESWAEILQNEKYWTRNTYSGWQRRITEILTSSEMKAATANVEKKYKTQQVRTRTLALDFAARAYELDKGHRPANASDLVPAYLKSVPIDPATGKEMKRTP
jgi:hypothetical protein